MCEIVGHLPYYRHRKNYSTVLFPGGRYPRSVSRLSFRRKKKLSLFGKGRTHRVDSKAELMAEDDTGIIISTGCPIL